MIVALLTAGGRSKGLLAVAVGATLALAATLPTPGQDDGRAVAAVGTTQEVGVEDNFFASPSVTIKRGDKVRWRSGGNGGVTTNAHNVWVTKLPKRLKKRKSKFRMSIPSTRVDWTRKFTVRGRYTFICQPHASTMRMAVVVE